MCQSLSWVRLCDAQTVAHQAPLSMGFSRQEYWSGLPFPSPEDLPNPGIKPVSHVSPALQADSLPLSHEGNPCTALFTNQLRLRNVKETDSDTLLSWQVLVTLGVDPQFGSPNHYTPLCSLSKWLLSLPSRNGQVSQQSMPPFIYDPDALAALKTVFRIHCLVPVLLNAIEMSLLPVSFGGQS